MSCRSTKFEDVEAGHRAEQHPGERARRRRARKAPGDADQASILDDTPQFRYTSQDRWMACVRRRMPAARTGHEPAPRPDVPARPAFRAGAADVRVPEAPLSDPPSERALVASQLSPRSSRPLLHRQPAHFTGKVIFAEVDINFGTSSPHRRYCADGIRHPGPAEAPKS